MSARNLITHLLRRWRYRNVTSLADLANVIADRYAGTDPLDAHAGTMRDALVALGRAGFVVVDAERGGPPISLPDGLLTSRAAVTMFAATDTWDWLDDVLYRSFPGRPTSSPYGELVYELFAPGRPSYAEGRRHGGVAVDRFDGVNRRHVGAQMDAAEVRRLFPVRGSVRDELHDGWLVTVFDRNWGRSDLFQFLLDAANDGQRTASEVA